jgi:hypothetical protein
MLKASVSSGMGWLRLLEFREKLNLRPLGLELLSFKLRHGLARAGAPNS